MKAPDSVDRQALVDAFATLGLDIADAVRIVITPHEMLLTCAVRDSDGHKVMIGSELATTVVIVGTPSREPA